MYIISMTAQFDAAIFFDNDEGFLKNVKDKCPGITLVKVNETEALNKSSLKRGPLKDLVDTLENNSYLYFLKEYTNWIPQYDPDSGIQQADIDKYYTWESTTSGNRILLLDWDLTLIMFEGMYLPYYDDAEYNLFKDSLVNPKDVAIFYLGGQKRFDMITQWLKNVAMRGIRIGILTNNSGCGDILFQMIVAEVVPKGSYEMMCSIFSPYNGNKGLILANDLRFKKFCIQKGGRRKTLRRRKSRKMLR